jgi:hypothetical protein
LSALRDVSEEVFVLFQEVECLVLGVCAPPPLSFQGCLN